MLGQRSGDHGFFVVGDAIGQPSRDPSRPPSSPRMSEAKNKPVGSVAQFAHIARPVASGEVGQHLRRDLRIVAAIAGRRLAHQLQKEQRDIVAPLGKRRHVQSRRH